MPFGGSWRTIEGDSELCSRLYFEQPREADCVVDTTRFNPTSVVDDILRRVGLKR